MVDYLHVYQLVHGDTAHAARHGYRDVALFVERIQLERFFEFEREVIVLNGFDEIADGVHLVPFLRELDHARDEQHGGGFIPLRNSKAASIPLVPGIFTSKSTTA